MRSTGKVAMARPRQHEIRDRQVNIKLTAKELEFVRRRAAAEGLRPVEYGRARLLAEWCVNEARIAAAPHLDPLFQVQLSRLGNNLNQIARRMHGFGEPGPPTLEPLLQEIRALIRRSETRDH